MLTVRCPHCGTWQPDAVRCWMCQRPFLSCAACVHFRRAVAGPSGYCGRDRHRAPLTGDEVRACWEAAVPPCAANGLFDQPSSDAAPDRRDPAIR